MKSFVTTLEEFFKLRGNTEKVDFSPSKRRLIIPLYQREYKWSQERVKTLIRDIGNKDKFLGLIILEERVDHYVIVDGQQRITTCLLALVSLFNLFEGHELDQQSIYNLIRIDNDFVLKNDSVGDYIRQNRNMLEVRIDEAVDIYYQKKAFNEASTWIYDTIKEISPDGVIDLANFLSKFKASKFLVLIKSMSDNSTPIEQIFIDFNEKSQKLDASDIFKGYCYKNFVDTSLHDELKNMWTQLQKYAKEFEVKFQYKGFEKYLYHYLLSIYQKINENLLIDSKHILDGKSMNETNDLLEQMIKYGKNIMRFYENLLNVNYIFEDICPSNAGSRYSNEYAMMKKMALEIMVCSSSQYQKLPFLMLLHKFVDSPAMFADLTNDKLKKVMANLYIYAALFTIRKSSKDKGNIERRLIEILLDSDFNKIDRLLNESKRIRKSAIEMFVVPQSFKEEHFDFIYSVIDFYDIANNFLHRKYEPPINKQALTETKEHFIINKSNNVEWTDGNVKVRIRPTEAQITTYKSKAVNYMVLDKLLNQSLGHSDVVSKIETIRAWYRDLKQPVPKHVELFMTHVEAMDSYRELVALKGKNKTQDEINARYISFIDSYFSDENQSKILTKIADAFTGSFRNAIVGH